MTRISACKLAAGLAATLLAATASATIVSGTIITGGPGATFVKLPVPFTASTPDNTVGADTLQSPNLFGFDESQNILLVAPLQMDFGGTLAAGTQVASHYIFFDPVSGSIDGKVDFDADILGIISSTQLLAASDSLANTGVTYLNPTLRGLESGDSVTVSGARQIHFVTTAASPGDYVRVITAFSPGAAVPEPASVALVLAALTGAGIASRRRHADVSAAPRP